MSGRGSGMWEGRRADAPQGEEKIQETAMTAPASYPMTITPLSEVAGRRDTNGRRYLAFRAEVSASGRVSQRTVRAFGARVEEALPKLRKGVPVSGRFSYDSFQGGAGEHSQTLRIVSINV